MSYIPEIDQLKKINIIENDYNTLIFKEIDYVNTNNELIKKIINEKYSCYFTIKETIIICFNPVDIIETDDDPLIKVKENIFSGKKFYKCEDISYPLFNGGYIGYYGYENICHIEKIVIPNTNNPTNIPINILCLYDSFIEINNLNKKVRFCSVCSIDENIDINYKTSISNINNLEKFYNKRDNNIILEKIELNRLLSDKWETDCKKTEFMSIVKNFKEKIRQGDFIQAVPSRRMYKYTSAKPYDIFNELLKMSPNSPYKYIFRFKDFYIIGASPELLVKIDKDIITTCPIAGTRPRGKDDEEDMLYEESLLNDDKEIAEHIMLVDLARNDIGKISKPASIKIEEYKLVKYFSNVMHICSKVSGIIKDEYDCLDALKAIFPAGTLSGAPKICAIQNIFDVEKERRNIYGGGIGFISYDKNLEMCICIRTILYKKGIVYLQAGCGIVYDSDPKSEFYESIYKMNNVKKAITNAEAINLKTDISNDIKVLIIDNYCSFTYNIYQYVSEIVENVTVIRNDEINIEECLTYTHIILGPGPKSPKDTSGYKSILDKCKGKIPILGICLGHQCLYTYFGGKISICNEIMHGKTSLIYHNSDKLYKNISNPFSVMRYHSLICDSENVPDCIEIICKTSNDIIMGIKHKNYEIYGLQFHPESIETNFGKQLLKNFLLIELFSAAAS